MGWLLSPVAGVWLSVAASLAAFPAASHIQWRIRVPSFSNAAAVAEWDALDELALLQATNALELARQEPGDDGTRPMPSASTGQHRVPLNETSFGDIYRSSVAAARNRSAANRSSCCMENTTVVVRSRSHVVNKTRVKEKMRQLAPDHHHKGRHHPIDAEVQNEIGDMIVKVNKVLDVLMRAGHRAKHRGRRWRPRPGEQRDKGILHFFQSVAFFDWCLLGSFMILFFAFYKCLLHWRPRRLYHGMTTVVWIALAIVYGLVIFIRQGENSASLWVSGYILELIFLIENVFVFHIVITAFKMPTRVQDNALFVVVVCQILFQVVFYMGLASVLTHWNVLPYILGVWLLYVGYHAATDDEHSEFNIMDSRVVRLFRWCLGRRLSTEEEEEAFITSGTNGKWCLTIAGLGMLCLVLADFLLEMDVTLAKIEGLGGAKIGPELEYLCFSSSAVASFTVPELYFVARDIFRRLRGLKYGIALVITYLGVQMLLGCVYTLPILVDVAIFMGVLICSGIISVLLDTFQDTWVAVEAEKIVQEARACTFRTRSRTWSIPSSSSALGKAMDAKNYKSEGKMAPIPEQPEEHPEGLRQPQKQPVQDAKEPPDFESTPTSEGSTAESQISSEATLISANGQAK